MRIDVLDAGYVELVESWGSDERIIEAARMSTAKGFQGWTYQGCLTCKVPNNTLVHALTDEQRACSHPAWGMVPGDEKLLRFLWENKHATPFEMGGLVLEVQAPIFVFREWHRHRTQSYNEQSARYTALPDVNYVPSAENLLERMRAALTTSNKQAQALHASDDAGQLDAVAEAWLLALRELYAHAQKVYDHGLRAGIPKELARLPVPVARYSRMRASANLRNWLAFLTLRMAPNAQFEIRQFANAVYALVADRFPRTAALFSGGR